MESSTPPASSSADDSNAQDPLALPNEAMYDVNRDQNGLCGSESSMSLSKESIPTAIYPNDPSIKLEEHSLNNEQRLQYEANHQLSSNYEQKMNQMSMQQQQQQQNLHEPHKTFSHSIENLSKTTEKCAPNDIKMWVARFPIALEKPRKTRSLHNFFFILKIVCLQISESHRRSRSIWWRLRNRCRRFIVP